MAMSVNCPHWPPMRWSPLSNTISTLQRLAGLRWPLPLKITSCIDSPRSSDALDSPSTQRTASITFDFPQPLGPTMPVMRPGKGSVTCSAKDLNPARRSEVKRIEVY
ncbi:hypothetical protein GALL_496970 [mine drainage metagenome]|uniref:Uncharacterized protein n=1 Tax=mine drainage metagenome TaxID=410659 RepID=A0A1J5PYK3_9ZZZZ